MKGQILGVVGALLLTVVPAVIHGYYSNRWGPRLALVQEAQRVTKLPTSFGNWEMLEETKDLSELVRRELALAEYVNRVYQRTDTGERVTLLLMVGQPGPLVRHPPTVCYRNLSQRTLSSSDVEISDQDTSHGFKRVIFQARDEEVGEFTVYYGYTANRVWSAPSRPRIAFGGEPALYKLQVLCKESGAQAGEQFLTDFVSTFQTFGA